MLPPADKEGDEQGSGQARGERQNERPAQAHTGREEQGECREQDQGTGDYADHHPDERVVAGSSLVNGKPGEDRRPASECPACDDRGNRDRPAVPSRFVPAVVDEQKGAQPG